MPQCGHFLRGVADAAFGGLRPAAKRIFANMSSVCVCVVRGKTKVLQTDCTHKTAPTHFVYMRLRNRCTRTVLRKIQENNHKTTIRRDTSLARDMHMTSIDVIGMLQFVAISHPSPFFAHFEYIFRIDCYWPDNTLCTAYDCPIDSLRCHYVCILSEMPSVSPNRFRMAAAAAAEPGR